MEKTFARRSRLGFRLLEGALALVFLGVVSHHVLSQDFKPLAALCLPILVIFYGFASLLFVRGRSLADGPWQVRSLYAAERAMQATLWYLFGILLGTAIYGLASYFGLPFDRDEPWLVSIWLLLFLFPYALMQIGVLWFLRAIRLVTPQLLLGGDAFEVARRVHKRRGIKGLQEIPAATNPKTAG